VTEKNSAAYFRHIFDESKDGLIGRSVSVCDSKIPTTLSEISDELRDGTPN